MTDGEIIDALGGTTVVAKAISADPRMVSNWRKRGISAAGRYKIRELAWVTGIGLPDDFLTRAKTP